MEELSLNDIIDTIKNDLAAKIGPLSLKQKFVLFMIPDDKLDDPLLTKKRVELGKFEAEFKATYLEGYRIDCDKSIIKISDQLKTLETLDFSQDKELKTKKLNALKENFQKINSEYSINTAFAIRDILKEIKAMQHPCYKEYSIIREILDLKNSIGNTNSIKIQTELLPEEYHKVCNIENHKQSLLESIEVELFTFKYVLSEALNDEIMFALTYVNEQTLRQYASKLHELVHRRKSLYRELYSAIPNDLKPDIKPFNRLQTEKYRDDDRDFLCYKLRQIIKIYCSHFREESSPLGPYSEKLNDHLQKLLFISHQTELTNITTYNRTYIDILTSQFGITQKDIAAAMGIHPVNISQQKKKGSTKRFTKNEWALAQIFNCSIDFLRGETTIPSYGKIFPDSTNPELEEEEHKHSSYRERIVFRAATAENLLSYFEIQVQKDNYIKTMLYNQGKAPSVLKITSLIRRKIEDDNYSVADFEFLTKLLEKL